MIAVSPTHRVFWVVRSCPPLRLAPTGQESLDIGLQGFGEKEIPWLHGRTTV